MRTISDDRQLVEAILDGDMSAFDALMQRYERLVYRVAFSFSHERETALDVTQNVFLKVFRKLGSFRLEASFKTWLLRIAYNESINWARSQRRHVEGRQDLEPIEISLSSAPVQENALLDRERWRIVLDRIDRLNPRYRLALFLRYFNGLSVREVAEVLDCTEGVAKNVLFRSVRRLREELA